MKRTILAVAVATGLSHPAPAEAQVVIGPGYGGGVGYGRGLGFSYHNKHKLSLFGFAGGYFAPPPFGLSPFYPGAPFGFDPGFVGSGFSWYATPQPQVIVVPPIILAGDNQYPDRVAGGGAVIRPDDPPRPAPVNPANFLVIEPKKPALPPPGKVVPEVDRVAKVDRLPQLPPPRFDPFAEPRRIDRDVPDPDPVKEAARLTKLGRDAFARGAYGKAAEHFERAAVANPKGAAAHFLKAQALFAAGSYADAVAAIRTGLALDPAWPTSAFDPKEPYGAAAALFAEHLADLRKAAAANPGEPALEFLLGYQLWFVGEKVEARKWFAAAQKRLANPEVIELFK